MVHSNAERVLVRFPLVVETPDENLKVVGERELLLFFAVLKKRVGMSILGHS